MATPQIVTHKVAKGETLMSISRKYTGSSKGWQKLSVANNIKPNKLRAGDVLVIPAEMASADVRPAAAAQTNQLAMLSEADLLPAKSTKESFAEPTGKTRGGAAKLAPARIAEKTHEKSGEKNSAKSAGANVSKAAKAAQPQRASRSVEKTPALRTEKRREVTIFDPVTDEQLVDAPKPVKKAPPPIETAKLAPPPRDLPALPAEREVSSAAKVRAVESAAASVEKPRRKTVEPESVDSSASVEKPAVFRKAGQKKEVPQTTRSNFYSCVADKCSYHTY